MFKSEMKGYGDRVRSIVTPYHLRLKEVSALVKSIGGEGRIYGCSVNLFEDTYVFVDPADMGLVLYTNIKGGMRIEESFPSEFPDTEGCLPLKKDVPGYVNRKDMRRMVQVTEALTAIVDDFIIRRWDDRVLEGASLVDLITIKDVRTEEDE